MISVIIPIYNISEYLPACLDSVINQSYKNLEIILVNDGSTDNSGDVCDTYAKKDSRIKVFHKKNGGVSSARNLGIENAAGEYIGFVDGDDIIEPLMFEKLITNMINKECDISCCQIITKNIDGQIQRSIVKESQMFTKEYIITNYFFDEFVKDLMYSQCNKIFKKELIKNLRYKKYKYGEDILFVFEALMRANKIYYDNYVGYYYLHREGSAMTKKFDINRIDYIFAIEEIKNYCEKYYEYAIEKVNSWVYQHILTFTRQIIVTGNKKTYKDIINKYINYLKENKQYLKKLKFLKRLDYYGVIYFNGYFNILNFIKRIRS